MLRSSPKTIPQKGNHLLRCLRQKSRTPQHQKRSQPRNRTGAISENRETTMTTELTARDHSNHFFPRNRFETHIKYGICWSHFGHMSVTLMSHFGHMSVTLMSHFGHMSVTLRSHVRHTYVTHDVRHKKCHSDVRHIFVTKNVTVRTSHILTANTTAHTLFTLISS